MIAAQFITDPLSLRFFQLGVLASVLTMIAGSGVGFFVIMRRESYLGHGIGQAMIAGLAVGSLLDVPPAVSALAAAVLAAGLINLFGKTKMFGADVSIAIVSTGVFSLGVAIISANRDRGINITNALFGNVLGVSWLDIATLIAASFVAWGFNYVNGRRLLLATVSPQVAKSHGIRTNQVEFLQGVALAAVVSAGVQVVGVNLVVVALVFPASIAAKLARTLAGVNLVSVISAMGIGVFGMYVSYWADLASGPSIVLVAFALYVVSSSIALFIRGY